MELPKGINVDDVLEQMRVLEAAMDPAKADTPYAKIALAFARALTERDFDRANQMLAPSLRNDLTPAKLEHKYYRMISYAGKTTATDVSVGSVSDDWPSKEDSDVGWVYVGISGPYPEGGVWNEAVAAVVSDSKGELLIRSVEWGRP